MLIIKCPWCGPRFHSEFAYGGDAATMRPGPLADEGEFFRHVYIRDNPRGPHAEYWQHIGGCRAWLRVDRDTLTHEIAAVRPAAEAGA